MAAWAPALALPWTIETVDSSGQAGHYVSLALDGAGRLHLCHYDSVNGDLLYARKSGGSWSYQAIDTSGDVGRYCAIVVGADNSPRISYFDSTNRALKFAFHDGIQWSNETADPGPGVGQYTSICLNGITPIISYYDQANRDLKFATKPGSWSRIQIDTVGDVGRYTSVANSGNNQTRIAYYSDSQKQLRFARQQGSANWIKETPDTATGAGLFNSLVLRGDLPTIAYWDSAGGRIKQAAKPSTSWAIDTVDHSGRAGGHLSLTLGPDDQPAISYFDTANGDLRLARRVGSSWIQEAVDTVGSVGWYTSCRIAADSTIYVAYYDLTRGWLKLARAYLDSRPPQVVALSLTPDTVRLEGFTVLSARITDNRNVAGAEYFLDTPGAPGTGLSPRPVAGFGPSTVDVFDTIFTATLSPGLHWVYLRGQDSSGLWSQLDSAGFYLEGPDTLPPSFSLQISPASPAIGAVLAISAWPSEPLHPDSTVVCTLRPAGGLLSAATMVRDSMKYSAQISTAGLAPGPCRLTVSGYDRWTNRGTSSLDFNLSATGELLPEGLVYVWPNPVRGAKAYFHYYVNVNASVTAEVYTMDGRLVARLQGTGRGGQPPHRLDSNAIVWDVGGAANDVYILRLTARSDAGDQQRTVTKKFAVVR